MNLRRRQLAFKHKNNRELSTNENYSADENICHFYSHCTAERPTHNADMKLYLCTVINRRMVIV